jgi:thiamine pyrophosphokinase
VFLVEELSAHRHPTLAAPERAATLAAVTGEPTVIVFTGGDAVPEAVADVLDPSAFVIAADSGLDHARALGRRVDVVIGDLDSVSDVGLASAEAAGVAVERHDRDKDETDLELALDAAMAHGAGRIVVVGGHGGRLDHFLANALLLAAPAYASAVVDALMGPSRVHVVHRRRSLLATPGETCTLLPVHGEVGGVTTEGLRWSLHDEALRAGTSRGVSNIVEEPSITVSVRAGTLLVVFPGALP